MPGRVTQLGVEAFVKGGKPAARVTQLGVEAFVALPSYIAPTVTWAGVDGATQGDWEGVYGADGYDFSNGVWNLSSAYTGIPEGLFTYAAWPADALMPHVPGDPGTRLTAGYFISTSGSPAYYNVRVNDGGTPHLVSLYFLDVDHYIRQGKIEVIDPADDSVIDTRYFFNGDSLPAWYRWNIDGSVKFKITSLYGGRNFALHGVTFDPAITDDATPATTLVDDTDTTTIGDWSGVYGADGHYIPNDPSRTSLPAGVQVSEADAMNFTTFVPDPAWTRHLQDPNDLGIRIMKKWYQGNPLAMVVDCGANTFDISTYLFDDVTGFRRWELTVYADGKLLEPSEQTTVPETTDMLVTPTWVTWRCSGRIEFHLNKTASTWWHQFGFFFDEVSLGLEIDGTGASIDSAEAMGSPGYVYEQLVLGIIGIASEEAVPATGLVVTYQDIEGVTGIPSAEDFPLGSLTGPITGVTGIASAEVMGSAGYISGGTIIGDGFSIVTLEAFGAGDLSFDGGPIEGVTGIPSGEDFPLGIVTGPIVGVTGIASLEAMGLGSLAQVGIVLAGVNGIASAEFFSSLGTLQGGPVGYLGIASAEKFGPGSVMRWDAEFLANSNYIVYVDGQPINDYLRADSISGDLQINFNGSCSFQTMDLTGAWEPEIGQEIVIMRYMAATDTWDRAFGGSVQNVQITRNPGETTTFHSITGVDYGHFAGRRVLNMKFDKEQYGTLTSILEFINSTILEEEGITWVNRGDPGTVIDTIEFNYIYLNQVFDQLKEITGWDWATDRWRNFYMYNRPAETIAAPTQIRDDTTGPYAEVHRNASVNRSRGLYRNVQHVKANIPTLGDPDGAGSGSGYYWSTAGGVVTESYAVGLNDGLRYFDGKLLEDHRYDGLVNEIISFKINGGDAVIWPVRSDGYWDGAPGGWDYRAIWPREISYIWDIVGRWDDAPGPGDTVTITFSSEAGGTAPPVISTDITDPATVNEITVRAEIEPGSGIYENVYDAGTIDDPALLETIANELLSQFNEMGLEVDFETYTDGLWPGQTLRVDLPGQGVDEKDLIVEQVSFQEEQKTKLLYRVKASNKVQQRDAQAAIARLIRRINKAPKVTGNSFLFELAPSQQGFVNAGIQVGNDVTPHAQTFQNFTCSQIIVMPKNAPTGSSATVNIKANGVSILQGGVLTIPAGSGEFTTSAFSTPALTIPAGATLTVDILSVGSSSPGSDISLQLVGFFG